MLCSARKAALIPFYFRFQVGTCCFPGFGKISKPPLESVGSNPCFPTNTTALGIFHGCGEGMEVTKHWDPQESQPLLKCLGLFLPPLPGFSQDILFHGFTWKAAVPGELPGELASHNGTWKQRRRFGSGSILHNHGILVTSLHTYPPTCGSGSCSKIRNSALPHPHPHWRGMQGKQARWLCPMKNHSLGFSPWMCHEPSQVLWCFSKISELLTIFPAFWKLGVT